MRTPLHPVIQWLLVAAFAVWSTILFCLIAGDENPDMPLPLVDFFLIKALAVWSAYGTFKAGQWCYYHSYFPEIVCKYFEECDKEEDEL